MLDGEFDACMLVHSVGSYTVDYNFDVFNEPTFNFWFHFESICMLISQQVNDFMN